MSIGICLETIVVPETAPKPPGPCSLTNPRCRQNSDHSGPSRRQGTLDIPPHTLKSKHSQFNQYALFRD